MSFSFHAHMHGKEAVETMIHILPVYITYAAGFFRVVRDDASSLLHGITDQNLLCARPWHLVRSGRIRHVHAISMAWWVDWWTVYGMWGLNTWTEKNTVNCTIYRRNIHYRSITIGMFPIAFNAPRVRTTPTLFNRKQTYYKACAQSESNQIDHVFFAKNIKRTLHTRGYD